MGVRVRWTVFLGGMLGILLLSGCLFNTFQTATLVQRGEAALVLGSGLLDVSPGGGGPAWALTPQVRLAFGLCGRANLGFQTGAMIPLATGSLGWLGASSDLKLLLFEDPGIVSLAIGIGGGYGIEFLGWGVFGELFLESHVGLLPLFVAYQPAVPLSRKDFTVWHHLAAGVVVRLSSRARLLLQVDWKVPSLSFGFAVDIGHRAAGQGSTAEGLRPGGEGE